MCVCWHTSANPSIVFISYRNGPGLGHPSKNWPSGRCEYELENVSITAGRCWRWLGCWGLHKSLPRNRTDLPRGTEEQRLSCCWRKNGNRPSDLSRVTESVGKAGLRLYCLSNKGWDCFCLPVLTDFPTLHLFPASASVVAVSLRVLADAARGGEVVF